MLNKTIHHNCKPRLSENAKHLSLISADPSALEAVNPESLRSRDEDRTEPPNASYFRKINLIRYKDPSLWIFVIATKG